MEGLKTMLAWALWYRRQGLHPIPIAPRAKQPLIKWERYQQEPPTEDEIEGWFAGTDEPNLGLVMGEVAGAIAIDTDGPEGEAVIHAMCTEITATSLTGKGR